MLQKSKKEKTVLQAAVFSFLIQLQRLAPRGQKTFGNKSPKERTFFAEELLPVGAGQGASAFCS
jgi:hypothetical protein